jgi:uncharacterized protein (DUF4415 family)
MKRKTKPANPIWKKVDFERAKRPEDVLPPEVLAQFPKHRGPQKAPTKIPISIRLSRDVLDHFKRGSPGWQSRIDEALRKIVGLSPPRRHGRVRLATRVNKGRSNPP